VILSVDVETYGACRFDSWGQLLPTQQDYPGNGRFHPYKSRFLDNPSELVITCSVTEVLSGGTDLQSMCEWAPGETRVFHVQRPLHRRWLAEWLTSADLLLGHNILFDILYLREEHPVLRDALRGTQTLLDTMLMSYMSNELRDEKSLKSLLYLFGLGEYETTLKHKRFPHPLDPQLIHYNAVDTHATVLVAQELARRMLREFPGVPKMSPNCLRFYSDDLWYTIRMAEAGVPHRVDKLRRIQSRRETVMSQCETLVTKYSEDIGHPLLLGGKGCKRTQADFLDYLVEEVDRLCTLPDNLSTVLDHPLLQRTDKRKAISWNHSNMHLFGSLLPKDHPAQSVLRAVTLRSRAEKVRSSYTYPLLHHQVNHPGNRTSCLLPLNGTPSSSASPVPPSLMSSSPCETIPFTPTEKSSRPQSSILPNTSTTSTTNSSVCNPEIRFAYCNWYIFPSTLNDSGDGAGGVIQPRASAKNPAIQTAPKVIKRTYCSRWPDGTFAGYDLSQIEPRVAALLSGDPFMVAEYQKEDSDLHRDMAVRIQGPSVVEHPEWKRNTRNDPRKWAGKIPNLLVGYRGRAARLRQSIVEHDGPLFPLEFCQEVVDAMKEARPGLWAWQESLLDTASRDGFLSLPILGHTRTFLGDVRGELESTVCNFPVQSWAAIILRCIQHAIQRRLPPMNHPAPRHLPCAQIHDAVYLDTRDKAELDGIVMDATREVETQGMWARLQDHYGNRVPLVMDID